jgi:hypothetical protein
VVVNLNEQLPAPALRVPVQVTLPVPVTVTVPVGAIPAPDTVKPTTTDSPVVDGFGVSDLMLVELVVLLTVKDTLTAVAEPKLELPAWLACTVTDPAPVMLNVLPLTVAGPEVTE